MTTRRSKPPIIEPPKMRIPKPDHEKIVVTLSGNDHAYEEPRSKMMHDVLRGYLLNAYGKMSQTIGATAFKYAERVAAASDIQGEVVKIQGEMGQSEMLLQTAAIYLALPDMFEAVCFALGLSPRERAYLQDNYDLKELFAAFVTISGCINRPFGGTRSGTAKAAEKPQTD